MRDIKRIDVLLSLIKTYWIQYPDFRLGQLLTVMNNKLGHESDMFYTEDTAFISILETELKPKEDNGEPVQQKWVVFLD